MSNEQIYTLVPSTNRGRYALDDPLYAYDVTGSQPLAILLGEHWIEGRVEHSRRYDGPGCYHLAGGGLRKPQAREALKLDPDKSSLQLVDDLFCGYYFLAHDGTVCGLCTGMSVRLR
jgi:hypothetical protein